MNRKNARFKYAASLLLLLLLFAGATSSALAAQGTAFSYQGRLQDSGANATGSYDFQFTLWDALSGGTQQPQPTPVTVTKTSVSVANGVFTVQLDFGASAFPGADRFLEISARLAGGGAFSILSPRQPISSTPYAIRSASASSADVAATATNASQLGGVAANQYVVTTDSRMSDSRAPTAGSSNYIQNTTSPQAASNFNISGNGTAGGTLSGNAISASTQFNIGPNRILSVRNHNIFVGLGTGQATTTGADNSFFGENAGFNNTTGGENVFLGNGAGSSNTTGANNTFVGLGAGNLNSTANANAFFGSISGQNNTTGSGNSFVGAGAGLNNSTGNSNSFFGNSAGSVNTIGSNNTAIGIFANFSTNNLVNASAIGANALVSQNNSLVLGSISGVNGASASTNVGIGTTTPTERLHVVGNGLFTGNLAVNGTFSSPTLNAGTQFNIGGNRILSTSGNSAFPNTNIFLGIGAGSANTPAGGAGIGNTFVGSAAGLSNTGGSDNSFFGWQAGNSNSGDGFTGSQNSFFGQGAGFANTNGDGNAFFGALAGLNNQGSGNSFFGTSAGPDNTLGNRNTFVGGETGSSNTSESDNTFVGFGASGVSGISNATAIGASALVTQSNSLVLGPIGTSVGIGTTAPAVTLEVQRNSTVASDWQTGQLRISGASNPNYQLSLGYDTSSNLGLGVIQAGKAFTGFTTLSLNPFGGRVGIGTTGPDQTLTVNGGASKPGGGSWATFSDERLKNIKGRFTPGLNAVMQLQPLRYEYKRDNQLGINAESEHVGFSAQEVLKVIPDAVTRDEKGFLLVNNDPIMWTMLNAIKEQQAQISQQQEQLKQQQEQIKRQQDQAKQARTELRAQQQQLDALKKLVCRSHPHASVCK